MSSTLNIGDKNIDVGAGSDVKNDDKTGAEPTASPLLINYSGQGWAAHKIHPCNFFHFYTVQENKIQSQTANYLHSCLLFLEIKF